MAIRVPIKVEATNSHFTIHIMLKKNGGTRQ